MKYKSLVAKLTDCINRSYAIGEYMLKNFAGRIGTSDKYYPWISVSNRLPRKNTGVFFVVERKDHRKGYYVGVYNGNNCWESCYHYFLPNSPQGKVVYWMPIHRIS